MLPEIEGIKRRRKVLGLTQLELANESGISQSALVKIESGNMNPSYETAKKILATLERLETSGEPRAKEKMTREVISLSPRDRIGKAKQLMKSKAISQIPVVEGEKPVGSITEGDIAFSDAKDGDPVFDVMGEPFPFVSEETALSTVEKLLRQYQAVLLHLQGSISGIITKTDIL